MKTIKIKVLSNRPFRKKIVGEVMFDRDLNSDTANGALCFYHPKKELLSFSKLPVAWYYCEPRWHSMYRYLDGIYLRCFLKDKQKLWYGHANPKFRVPHITHQGKPQVLSSKIRNNIGALVSNCGTRFGFLSKAFSLRNQFILNPKVQLYGSRKNWTQWSYLGRKKRGKLPKNYCGEPAGSGWSFHDNIRFLARFHAVVCFENAQEPFYFTEKFANAVQAGCIPIYHAHPTVRSTFLSKARWIDPSDYNFDSEKTLSAAMNANRDEYNYHNSRWLQTAPFESTSDEAAWNKIADIFKNMCI